MTEIFKLPYQYRVGPNTQTYPRPQDMFSVEEARTLTERAQRQWHYARRTTKPFQWSLLLFQSLLLGVLGGLITLQAQDVLSTVAGTKLAWVVLILLAYIAFIALVFPRFLRWVTHRRALEVDLWETLAHAYGMRVLELRVMAAPEPPLRSNRPRVAGQHRKRNSSLPARMAGSVS